MRSVYDDRRNVALPASLPEKLRGKRSFFLMGILMFMGRT